MLPTLLAPLVRAHRSRENKGLAWALYAVAAKVGWPDVIPRENVDCVKEWYLGTLFFNQQDGRRTKQNCADRVGDSGLRRYVSVSTQRCVVRARPKMGDQNLPLLGPQHDSLTNAVGAGPYEHCGTADESEPSHWWYRSGVLGVVSTEDAFTKVQQSDERTRILLWSCTYFTYDYNDRF